jgi:hypothetical protein
VNWEKNKIAVVTAYIVLGYAFIFVARPIVIFLRENNLLRISVALIGVSVAAGLFRLFLGRLGLKLALAWIITICVFYSLLFGLLERPEERMHLVQYGLLPPMLMSVFAGLGKQRAWCLSLLLGGICGALDEFIQILAPGRVFEWRDVHLNIGAAFLGSIFALPLQRSSDISGETRL